MEDVRRVVLDLGGGFGFSFPRIESLVVDDVRQIRESSVVVLDTFVVFGGTGGGLGSFILFTVTGEGRLFILCSSVSSLSLPLSLLFFSVSVSRFPLGGIRFVLISL